VSLLYAALLGVIQGLTEFLPVSSSAHLILARAFFGWNSDEFGLAFDVACHVGTLAAVVIYFWRDVLQMMTALPAAFSGRPAGPARLLWTLVAGTIPVAIFGVLLANTLEERLRTPEVAAVSLAVVAFAFFAVERFASKTRREASLGFGEAFVIGCAQAGALVPGVSRSGSTIAASMACGLRRDEAARFTFLLGIPAILAAAAHEGVHVMRQGLAAGETRLLVVGAVTSAAVGYFTVKYFIRYLGRHSLGVFAWYRLALAATVVVWWFVR